MVSVIPRGRFRLGLELWFEGVLREAVAKKL